MNGAGGAMSRAEGVGPVDTVRLVRWMDAGDIGPEGEPVELRALDGGGSNEVFELRRGPLRAVLRRPPRELPEGRNEALAREQRVLLALDGTDVPHPRVLGACDDPSVLGSTFTVMELVDGWSPLDEGGWPAPFDRDPEARRGLAFELVEGIARLAGVDWRARGLDGFGRPEGFHDRQVDRWLAHWEGFRFREIPGLDVAASWLRTHRPRRWSPGILHGDYQFANVMYRHGPPARLAAVIDWEMATVGDPLLDLGWLLMAWPDPGEDVAELLYVDFAGMPSRHELVERYAEVSGRPVDDVDYYVILARFKMAIVLEQGYARHVRGEASNPKVAAFGDWILRTARNAAELAESTDLR